MLNLTEEEAKKLAIQLTETAMTSGLLKSGSTDGQTAKKVAKFIFNVYTELTQNTNT